MSTLIKPTLFALASGIMLYLAWPTVGLFPVLFVAFIPMIFALTSIAEGEGRLKWFKSILVGFLGFGIWHALVLVWLYRTSHDTYSVGVILNSFNYAVPLMFFPHVYKKLGKNFALGLFVCGVLISDWLSQTSMFASPFFIAGLGLGETPWLIQHYKWIGVEGGTLWIILTNVVIYKTIAERKLKSIGRLATLAVLIVFVPVVSIASYNIPANEGDKSVSITIHHSSINPFTDEGQASPEVIIDKLFQSSLEKGELNSDVVMWPESIIIQLGWLNQIDEQPSVKHLKELLQRFPNTTVILGGMGFTEARSYDRNSSYTTYVADGDYYFRTHNVAVAVSANEKTKIRSKEIFIPFQERIPCNDQLPFLENLVETVGLNAKITPYEAADSQFSDQKGNTYESILCYESLFPLYMIEKTKHGIGAFLIHANEHWMKDITGSEQYLFESIPIAIQCGRPIFRSSNQGTSALIDVKGNIKSTLTGNTTDNIIQNVPLNYNKTIYSHIAGSFYGLSGIVSFLIIGASIIKKRTNNL